MKSGKKKFNNAIILLNRPACTIVANTEQPVIITNDAKLQAYLENVQFNDVDDVIKLKTSFRKITNALSKLHSKHIGASKRCPKHVNPTVRKICHLINEGLKATTRRISVAR